MRMPVRTCRHKLRRLRAGERVTIDGGPLQGLKAVVVEDLAQRVVVSILLDRKSTLVELDRDWIRQTKFPPHSAIDM